MDELPPTESTATETNPLVASTPPPASVLIAEDEDVLRQILAQTFTDAGFKVIQAQNGKQALELALSQKPSVTILDIMMPEMDGMEALKKIRLDPVWGANSLIIMLTNLTADNKILEQMAESSPSYYFVKSDMEPDQLLAKVREIMQ